MTITATINIPQAFVAGSGDDTWISYAVAMVVILLVVETLVLFRHHPPRASGIAGYVAAGLGPMPTALASWALVLGYGAVLVACLGFLSAYVNEFMQSLGIAIPEPALFLLIGGLCLVLARRDVQLSASTMLLTEGISVMLVMGLCALVLQQHHSVGPLSAISRTTDGLAQVGSGLTVAVFSFIGFESAANLGEEAHNPEQALPLALRTSVLVAGGLFLFWAWVLVQGLATLPEAERLGVEPLVALANQLGDAPAGMLIKGGAMLSLFGSSLGSVTALGRVVFALSGQEVFPNGLQAVHPRFQTPALALACSTMPLLLGGAWLVAIGVTPQSLYKQFGSFSVLAFLLVYGLVACAALRRQLPATSWLRRSLVAGACLVAISAVLVSYGTGLAAQQSQLLWSFAGAMALGSLLSFRSLRPQAAAGPVADHGDC
jgi:amino acid transporter